MYIIEIQYQNTVHDLQLIIEKKEYPQTWKGLVSILSQEPLIRFFVKENRGIKLSFVDNQIETPKDLIEERIEEALQVYYEKDEMGFDPEDDTETNEQLLNPYNPENIKIRKDTFNIFHINQLIEKKEIDLNPEFQRHFVWDTTRRSRLIESIILGIPIPLFYFSEGVDDGIYYVIDGLQRLTTIHEFLENKFALKNLEYLPKSFERKFAKDLERKYLRRIEQTQVVVNIIEKNSPPNLKFDIFKRINTGGKPLNGQEIRNCFANANTRSFMRELAYSESFKLATCDGVKDKRMDAQELVLRFASFYVSELPKFLSYGHFGDYTGGMQVFLDKSLAIFNEKSNRELKPIKNAFINAMNNAKHLFGQMAFRKIKLDSSNNYMPINKSLFLAWSTLLADIPNEQVRQLPENFMNNILAEELSENPSLWEAISVATNDKRNLSVCFHATQKLIHQHITQKNELYIENTKL